VSESSLVVLSVVIALIVPWAVSAAMTVLGSAGLSRCRQINTLLFSQSPPSLTSWLLTIFQNRNPVVLVKALPLTP